MDKLLLYLFLSLPVFLNAQYFEMGASVGMANYMGELTSNSSRLYLSEAKISAGAFARYNINNYLGLRLHLNYGSISGTDANSGNSAIRTRNLSFQTNLYEVGLIGEINILRYDPTSSASFSPYLFGGIAFYKFNPQAELDGQLFDLQPLKTEGQSLPQYPERLPYELKQLSVPFGFGFKYALSENINIGLEVGIRKTFTDYLDDVSLTYPDLSLFDDPNAALLSDRSPDPRTNLGQGRGDTKPTDWYFLSGFTISYIFSDSGLIGGRRYNRNKVGCPTF